MAKCEDCGNRIKGRPAKTMLGRTVCQRCSGLLSATVLGAMGAQSGDIPGTPLQGAIVTRGFFGYLYDRARGKR